MSVMLTTTVNTEIIETEMAKHCRPIAYNLQHTQAENASATNSAIPE